MANGPSERGPRHERGQKVFLFHSITIAKLTDKSARVGEVMRLITESKALESPNVLIGLEIPLS